MVRYPLWIMILTTEGLGHPQFGGDIFVILVKKEMFCEVYMAII